MRTLKIEFEMLFYSLFIALAVQIHAMPSTILDVSDFTFHFATLQYTLKASTSHVLFIHHHELATNITVNATSLAASVYQPRNPNVLELHFSDDQEWDDILSILRMPMTPSTTQSAASARDHPSRRLLQYDDDSLEDHGSVLYPHHSPMQSHMMQDMMHNPQMMQMMAQMMKNRGAGNMQQSPMNNNMAAPPNGAPNAANGAPNNNNDPTKQQQGKKCSGNCNPCGESPCDKKRRRDRRRKKWRRRSSRKRVRRQKRRERWRERLRKLRHHNDRKLERELESLKVKHAMEGRTYAWIADLLHRKVMAMKQSGQIPPFGRQRRRRRRRMVQREEGSAIQGPLVTLQQQRCRVITNEAAVAADMNRNFMFCMAQRQDDEIQVEIKFVTHATVARRASSRYNYRAIVNETEKYFDSEYNDKMHANPIYRGLGHMLNRYESMDWHSFPITGTAGISAPPQKYAYGEFASVGENTHYFDVFEFMYKNVADVDVDKDVVQCSPQLPDLPFKLCVKRENADGDSDADYVLYFEKDASDTYSTTESYSFMVKELIDKGFEQTRFRFGNDEDWDEIEAFDTTERKCSYRLMTAKICVEMDDGNKLLNFKYFSYVS